MDKQKIYCLVKHGMPRIYDYKKDRYSFVVISRKNGKVKEYPLPNVTKEDKCLGYGISAQDGKSSPFVFLKKRDKYLIRKYEI